MLPRVPPLGLPNCPDISRDVNKLPAQVQLGPAEGATL